MTKSLSFTYQAVAALFLGMSLTLAFAPFDIFPLSLIAMIGLAALLLNSSAKQAFWLGYAFGLGLFSTGVYWIYISIHFFGDVPPFLSFFVMTGLAGILALYTAIPCYLANRYFPPTSSRKIICALPALWVLSEWLRSWLFSGFPWLYLGYSQIHSPLKGYAPIFSVYGISLALMLSSTLILNAILEFRQKRYKQMYFCLLATAVLWLGGSALTLKHWTQAQGQPINVSLVQGNIPQSIKWSPEHLQLSLDTYEKMTQDLWGKDKIIIWPEAAVPMSIQEANDFLEKLDQKAIATGSHLILGIPVEQKNHFYNSVISLGKDKNIYFKRRLVPFGEFTPLENYLMPLLKWLNVPSSELIEGDIDQDNLIINQLKIQPAICFEIAFPELVNPRDSETGIILTVTNDAWFGHSTAQAQHLQIAEMRALELGRPVLFASNDGITAIIDAQGQVIASLPAHQAGVLNGQVQAMMGMTPWMQAGMNPILALILSLLIRSRDKKPSRFFKKLFNPFNR